MQFSNRTVLPKSPFRKGDLKPLFPTFNWLREHICSLRQVLQQIPVSSRIIFSNREAEAVRPDHGAAAIPGGPAGTTAS